MLVKLIPSSELSGSFQIDDLPEGFGLDEDLPVQVPRRRARSTRH